ncbi:hypothetical protein ACIQ9E_07705 [Streptomyces sp. NPDC094448]|uniref:hypothetical protein n=1 Tax=Streptomyces sp. NPDC094448 TaxID=3366063 RepID=UPI00380DB176
MAPRETTPDGGNTPDTSVRRAAAVAPLAQEPAAGLFPTATATAAAAAAVAATPDAPAPAAAPPAAGEPGSSAARSAAAPAAGEPAAGVPTVSGAPAASGTTAAASAPAPAAAAGAEPGTRAAAGSRTGAVSAVRARLATATRAAGPGSGSGSGTGTGADGTPPGRPNKPLIAAAALGGLVLIAVPFLISETSESDEKRKPAVAEGPRGSLMNPDGSDPGLVPGEERLDAPGSVKGSPARRGVTPAAGGTSGAAGGGSPALAPVPGPQEAGAPLPGAAGSAGTGTAVGPATGTGGKKAPAAPAAAVNPKAPATTPAKKPPAVPGTKAPATNTPSKSGPAAKPPAPAAVTYSHLIGPGCDTPGFAAGGRYDSKGKDRWRGSRGSTTGYGCSGFYFSVPMSDRSTDDSWAQWKFTTGKVTKGVCAVQVYIPNVRNITYVGGSPAYYTVYRAFTQKSSNVLGTFSLNQTSHLGGWVNAGSYRISGGKISVVLGNRGSDSGNRHAAAAPVRVSCTAS